MSLALRLLASLLVGGAAAVVAASLANAAPIANGESATTVIDRLQKQGYAVEVNGSPAGDTSLLKTCTATTIHDPTTDPVTATKTVNVDVACPLTHG